MNTSPHDAMSSPDLGRRIERIGAILLRYGLVVALLWIGALKFTAYEAANIRPLVTNSPLTRWGNPALGERGFSGLIGAVEITAGVLIALRLLKPLPCVIGSGIACVMFLTTLSFLFTTPGVWQPDYGFPFPSGTPGQFLAKDLVLLGVALWSLGEALRANSRRATFMPNTMDGSATG